MASFIISESASRKYYLIDFRLTLSWLIKVSATSLSKASIFYFDGIPENYRIFSSWFRVDYPEKIGSPISSSAIIHPTLQTSVCFV